MIRGFDQQYKREGSGHTLSRLLSYLLVMTRLLFTNSMPNVWRPSSNIHYCVNYTRLLDRIVLTVISSPSIRRATNMTYQHLKHGIQFFSSWWKHAIIVERNHWRPWRVFPDSIQNSFGTSKVDRVKYFLIFTVFGASSGEETLKYL